MGLNVIYFQSGGPTAVINSSFYGLIKKYQKDDSISNLYGSRFGIEGIINDDLIKIDRNKDYKFLLKTPGAILGSSRLKIDNKYYNDIDKTINQYNINLVIVNGGNDSCDTALKLEKHFKDKKINCHVSAISKTIDNDLYGFEFSFGFPSALNSINESIIEISNDINSYKKGRVTIVETMGRDAGWLAASSCVSNKYNLGPDFIYVSEKVFDLDLFLKDVEDLYNKKKKVLVVVSEALKDNEGKYMFANNSKMDEFKHVQLGSVANKLCAIIENRLNINTRHIELNLMQRCASHFVNSIDQKYAIKAGEFVINKALKNKFGDAGVVKDKNKNKLVLQPLNTIANVVKNMPDNFINNTGNGISKTGFEYFNQFAIDLDKKYKNNNNL